MLMCKPCESKVDDEIQKGIRPLPEPCKLTRAIAQTYTDGNFILKETCSECKKKFFFNVYTLKGSSDGIERVVGWNTVKVTNAESSV